MYNYSQGVLVMEERDLDSKEINSPPHCAGATHPAQLAPAGWCPLLRALRAKEKQFPAAPRPGATVGSALHPAHSHGPDPCLGHSTPCPVLAGLVSRLPFIYFSSFVTWFFQWSRFRPQFCPAPLPTC